MKRLFPLLLLIASLPAFGQIKISALPAASSANLTDLLPDSQCTTSGCTKKVTVSQLQAVIQPAISGDVTKAAGSASATVTGINGASVPASANCMSTNGSAQPVAGCPEAVNAQTGTTYTVATTDCGKQLTFTNALA